LNLSIDIARRYLFGKKSTNAINVITGISVLGMTIGTASLIIILSVFNGFESLVSSLLNSYNPDLKVVPKEGLYLQVDSFQISQIFKIPGIVDASSTLEEVVLFDYSGTQEAGYLKGVDDHFNAVTNIDTTIIRGEFLLKDEKLHYAVLGSGMFSKLSINPADPITPISAYAPRKNNNPLGKDFSAISLYPAGEFSIGSVEDGKYILTDLATVQQLVDKFEINALEIKLQKNSNEATIIKALQNLLGKNIIIKNRYQQDEAFLKIMNIEKWISYLIACLTMILISFNLVGALWMIVLDKKKDISVLKSMGFTTASVKNLILYTGVWIGGIGLVLGTLLAIAFYILQKKFALIAVPSGFMIDAYPIEMRPFDFILVGCTVIVLSLLASLLPAGRASRITAFIRQE
jgi:lipoprotein-releasing system permease protein